SRRASSPSTGETRSSPRPVSPTRARSNTSPHARQSRVDPIMTGIVALYIFMLAAFTGYEVISRVPVILHTPLMSLQLRALHRARRRHGGARQRAHAPGED